MCIRKSVFFLKNYILIILVDFYVSLSRFFLLPRSGSSFPEVDDSIRNTEKKYEFICVPTTKKKGDPSISKSILYSFA